MKVEKEKNNKLYNYLFHFNHHQSLWNAIPRDRIKDYFNNMNERVNTGILKAKDISTLLEFLSK